MHSPINRSQTPIHHTSTSPTSPVRKRPQSNSSSGSQYLQHVLGDVLAEALSQVAKRRPTDPIQYVADYLHSVSSDDNQPSHLRGKYILIYYYTQYYLIIFYNDLMSTGTVTFFNFH